MSLGKGIVYGVVIAGSGSDSDPQAGGRVRVHSPTINNGQKNKKEDYPWLKAAHEASSLGGNTNAGPPQIGTTVIMNVAEGMQTTFMIPFGALNTQLSKNVIGQGKSLIQGLISDAQKYIHPERSGPAQAEQHVVSDNGYRNSEVNGSTLKPIPEAKDVPVVDKQEINSNNGANPSTVPTYKIPKNIGTALDEAQSIMTSALNGLLPGIPLNMTNMLGMLTDDMKKELQKVMLPEIYTAMENLAKNSGTITPVSGVGGYTQDTNNVNPETFAANALVKLKTITNKAELLTTLSEIQTSETIKDLASILIPDISFSSHNGDLTMSLKADGTLTINTNDIAEAIKSAFSSFMSGLPAAGGSSKFQSGSDIPGKLLNRMPVSIQSGMKEFLQRVGGTNNTPRTQVESVLTNLLGKL